MSQLPPPPPPPPPPAGPPPSSWPGPSTPQWGPPGGTLGGWHGAPGQPAPAWGWPPQHPVLPGSGRFRAQAVGDLLDSAFTLYRRNLRLIVAITAVAQLPLALFSYLAYQLTGVSSTTARLQQLSAGGRALTSTQVRTLLPSLIAYVAVVLGIALLQWLVVQPIATAAMTRAVGNIYLEQPASVSGAYRAVLQRIWPVVGVSLFLFGAGVALLVGSFALLAGALYLLGAGGAVILAILVPAAVFVAVVAYTRWMFAAPIVMLERSGAGGSLRRSWLLVRGCTARVFGITLLVGIITGILSAIVGALLSVLTQLGDETLRLILTQLATLVVAVLIQPITFIVVVLLYYDLRIRVEAFDIEMLAAAI